MTSLRAQPSACDEIVSRIASLPAATAANGKLPPPPRPETVKEACARLASVVGCCEDAIICQALDDTMVLWNPAAERIFGHPASEAIGQKAGMLVPPEGAGEMLLAISAVKHGERAAAFETDRIQKGGHRTRVSLSISPVRDAGGRIVGIVQIARDVSARQRMEEANARLAAIVESSDDGIIGKTLEGIITTWNAAAERIFGYSAAEVIGRSITMLIPPDRQDEESMILACLRRGERVDHLQTQRVTKAGRLIDVSITVSPIRDSSGALVGASKIVRDITRPKQAETALRLNERMTPALQAAGIGLWNWNLNANTVEYYGAPASFATGPCPAPFEMSLDQVLPEDRTPLLQAARRAIDGDGQFVNEYRMRTPDQGLRWMAVRGHVIRDADGRATYIAGITLDVTDQKLTERALEESERFKQFVLDSLPAHIAVLDRDGNIVAVNEAWARFARENDAADPRKVSIGANYLEVCRRAADQSVPDAQPALCVIQGVLQRKELRLSLEYPCHSPAEERWFLMTAVALPADIGGAVVAHFDVTALKQAKEQMQRAKEAAEAATATKDLFLSTATHELRTPLAAILLWTELLRKSRTDEERAEALAMIEDQAHAQSRLVEDILDASRVSHGKLRVDLKPVDLQVLLRTAAEAIRPTAEAAGLQWQMDVPAGTDVTVLGDAPRLRQIISNLLNNAVKFTPSGGRVQVRLALEAAAATIQVADSGKGIDPAFMPHLFEQFSQAPGSASKRRGGLGLGLSIVKYLVDQHHGRISAASAGPGRGATFTVTLPLAGHSLPAESPEKPAPPCHPDDPMHCPHQPRFLDGIRVLVVDDDLIIGAAVAKLLKTQGAEVVNAASGAEAYDLLRLRQHDVLVCDIAMPDEDGYAFIDRVRHLSPEHGGRIGAIALTALGDDATLRRSLDVGFDELLRKPMEPQRLLDLVAMLGHQRAQRN